MIVSKILAGKCRRQPLHAIECDVVTALPRDVQWRAPLDGANTLERVVADCTIPTAGYLGTGSLLNVTQLHSLVIRVASITFIFLMYNSHF